MMMMMQEDQKNSKVSVQPRKDPRPTTESRNCERRGKREREWRRKGGKGGWFPALGREREREGEIERREERETQTVRNGSAG